MKTYETMHFLIPLLEYMFNMLYLIPSEPVISSIHFFVVIVVMKMGYVGQHGIAALHKYKHNGVDKSFVTK